MKKRILSIILILCMMLCLVPITAYAVQDATKNSAKSNFGLTGEKVNYVYLNDKGAYKGGFNHYPHFIESDNGIYHIHGRLDMNSKLPDLYNKNQYPNNIEVKAGGTVKLLFDGTLDGAEGLVWDYSALGRDGDVRGLTNEYSMIKLKDGKNSSKPTNVEIHFAGKCTVSAPRLNAAINAYGTNCHVTVVLHDDCDVTLRGGATAAAIGGSNFEEGRNITIKTDGKYDLNGNRISYKANGKLTCYGGDQAAAIGSSNWSNADNITIESGTVYAHGGDGGAGIGSGLTTPLPGQENIAKATNIKITGGNVYAFGSDGAAAIGGGNYSPAENISFTGGSTEATAGKGASAIGGGSYGGTSNITVSGGRVKAALVGSSNSYPIGRGHKSSQHPVSSQNTSIRVSDNAKASFSTTLKNHNEFKSTYYSCDSFDMGKVFGFIIDQHNNAISSAEIIFESCTNHSLTWESSGHYQYCSNCQSVKAYDDAVPTMSGITESVLTGSWVNFDADDGTGGGSKSINHIYYADKERRSTVFNSVPRVASGIKDVTVDTYTYDTAEGKHSTLSGTETLSAESVNGSKKSYRFRGANTYDEYTAFRSAQTTSDKLATLKLQRITITDNAGNAIAADVYAFLTHRVQCYVNGVKQILNRDTGDDYIDLLRGNNLKLTFLKDHYAPLDYQYFYEVTVNGSRIPTTEDNVYEFNNIREDLIVHIITRFDETSPQLAIGINGDTYTAAESGNDQSSCRELNVGAVVTLTAEDIAPEGHPASGIRESSLAYLISERSLTEAELDSSDGWVKYTGAFTLPDSKVSIVYAKVQDIAGNAVYAASAPYLPDESLPTIAGLQENGIYCGSVRFTASDKNGIEKVQAGDTVLTADGDGKYTLEKGLGNVTVTVTDKAGNSVSVTVTVNADHTACADDGDCTTPVYCVYHPDTVVIPAKYHDFSGVWLVDDSGHRHACQNEGCRVKESPIAHSGTDDGDCTTAVNCVCGYVITAAQNEHNLSAWSSVGNDTHNRHCQNRDCRATETENCFGGTATCTKQAVCEICGEKYGAVDPDNHTDTTEWIQTETRHTQKYKCCGAVTVAEEAHEWENGACSECGYECLHTGGTATCTKKAVCEICGESYGDLDAKNHTDLKHIEAKAATEKSEGNTEYWYCSDCGKYYADRDGTKEIAKTDTVTAKLPEKKPTSPKTGDSSNLLLWFSLLTVSCGAGVTVAVYGKKKRQARK